MNETTNSVAVAVSGGADSLYTLLSLHEAGVPVMAVHGIFGQYLEPWLAGKELGERGKGHNPRADAVCLALEHLCDNLGIPLHFIDCAEEFLATVIRPFVELYAKGHTPNPCSLCNAEIKLGILREKAHALGASYLATGHYVRLRQTEGTNAALLQGIDINKDQSYFLALVPSHALACSRFPLGGLCKSEVVATLAQRGLQPPQPDESQEVCFIPQDEYRTFLPRAAHRFGIPLSSGGPMQLEDGTRIGTHKGLWQYTEGQRKGLGVGWKEPLYVLAKECEGNILRLGQRNSLRTAGCVAGAVNILLPPAQWPAECYVKTRYREQPKRATVVLHHFPPCDSLTKLHVSFAENDAAIAAGQVAAVYIPVVGEYESDGRPVLQLVAGGIIEQLIHPEQETE